MLNTLLATLVHLRKVSNIVIKVALQFKTFPYTECMTTNRFIGCGPLPTIPGLVGKDVNVNVVKALTTTPIYNTRAIANGKAAFTKVLTSIIVKVAKPTASRNTIKCRTP